jgi:hypothetical protein
MRPLRKGGYGTAQHVVVQDLQEAGLSVVAAVITIVNIGKTLIQIGNIYQI